ncbi:hypothetical protein [Pseudomonas sp. SDO55104_S430]
MSAYISTELNMVKELDPARHELALKVEEYLSRKGTIEVLPFWVEPKGSTETRTMTPNFQTPDVKAETDKQAARIREMAKTMNQREICEAEGILRGVLRGIGRRYGITFAVGAKITAPPNKASKEAEEKLVEKIKEAIAQGVNRNQCCKLLTISTTLLRRLIEDYDLDYPKVKPAFK